MRYQKLFLLGMTLSLVACGSSTSKGDKVSKEEFVAEAQERENSFKSEAPYYRARINVSYTNTSDKSDNGTAERLLEYNEENSKWEVLSTESTSTYAEGYLYYFEYTMSRFDELIYSFAMIAEDSLTYYVSSSSSTLEGKSDASGGDFIKSSLSISWDQYGCLKSLKSVNKISIPYVGSSTSTLKINMKYFNA